MRFQNRSESPINSDDFSSASRSRPTLEVESDTDLLTRTSDVPALANDSNELSEQQKKTIRVIRKIKYFVARRKFQQARKPYDVRDVIEQYSQGNNDLMVRLKELQRRIDQMVGMPKGTERERSKNTLNARLLRLEEQVNIVNNKLDNVLNYLKNSKL